MMMIIMSTILCKMRVKRELENRSFSPADDGFLT